MSNSNFVKGECRHCAGHLEFPTAGLGETIACPHCGQPTELTAPFSVNKINGSKRRWWGLILSVAVLGVGLATVLLVNKKSGRPANSATPASAATPTSNFSIALEPAASARPLIGERTNDFFITDIQLEKRPGNSLVFVTGTVQNLSPRQRFGVKVEFGLFDRDEKPVGAATDYQPMLEPNGHWQFKAMVMDPKAASTRLNFIRDDQP